MKFIFSILFLVTLFSAHSQKIYEYDHLQIQIGVNAYNYNGGMYHIGLAKYKLRDKTTVFRYGIDIIYNQRKSFFKEPDYNKIYDSVALSVGKILDRYTKSNNHYFLRCKPFFEYGRKIIIKRKYSSDLTLVTGIGLNLFRKENSTFYWLDSDGKPVQPLISEKNVVENFSYFKRPDVFLGLRSAHNFKLKDFGDLFFAIMLGYDLSFYQFGYKGICFQFDLGFSLKK